MLLRRRFKNSPKTTTKKGSEKRHYTVKKVIVFSLPSRDVKTKLSLAGNYELFPARESVLVSDIPAVDG
jgi:hypothetical protein